MFSCLQGCNVVFGIYAFVKQSDDRARPEFTVFPSRFRLVCVQLRPVQHKPLEKPLVQCILYFDVVLRARRIRHFYVENRLLVVGPVGKVEG